MHEANVWTFLCNLTNHDSDNSQQVDRLSTTLCSGRQFATVIVDISSKDRYMALSSSSSEIEIESGLIRAAPVRIQHYSLSTA